MKEKHKARYSIVQNIRFMLGCAWKTEKTVPFLVVGLALLTVAQELCRLYIAPQILSKVEQNAPLSELLLTITVFTALSFLLAALVSYVKDIRKPGGVDIRSYIIGLLSRKSGMTSFPNSRDPELAKLREQAFRAADSNQSPAENIWRTLMELFSNILGFAVYLVLLSDLDLEMLLIVLLTSLLGFLFSRRANLWEVEHREEESSYQKEIRYIDEISQQNNLAKDIRIFGLADWLREIRMKSLRTYESFCVRGEKVRFFCNLADVLLTVARNGIAYYYILSLCLRQELSAADFLLYFGAVSGMTRWIGGILQKFSTLHQESIQLSYVQEYLNCPEPFRFEGGKAIPKAESYELKLEAVTFRYPGSERNILEKVDLTIKPGENLAIVGLNGAGKTTLVLLLCGFYDPTEGRVLLNGQDIRDFNRQEYYGLLSAVFQDFTLLDVTIAQQVAQTAEDIDNKKLWDCLKKAGLKDFVGSLPQKEQTHMGREVYLDGVLLSGGQTQRLMLARALYKGGPILVLDEPTAALDPIAENDIYMKYKDMTEGKTSLFISHRLASTRFCDRILYVADGKISEEGTHEELLAKGGDYAKLFEIQSRYYQEGGDDHGKE